MNEIGANDARTYLVELLERAEGGEETSIEAQGEVIVMIAPVPPKHDIEAARAAILRVAKAHPIPNLTIEEIKSWIEEGRP